MSLTLREPCQTGAEIFERGEDTAQVVIDGFNDEAGLDDQRAVRFDDLKMLHTAPAILPRLRLESIGSNIDGLADHALTNCNVGLFDVLRGRRTAFENAVTDARDQIRGNLSAIQRILGVTFQRGTETLTLQSALKIAEGLALPLHSEEPYLSGLLDTPVCFDVIIQALLQRGENKPALAVARRYQAILPQLQAEDRALAEAGNAADAPNYNFREEGYPAARQQALADYLAQFLLDISEGSASASLQDEAFANFTPKSFCAYVLDLLQPGRGSARKASSILRDASHGKRELLDRDSMNAIVQHVLEQHHQDPDATAYTHMMRTLPPVLERCPMGNPQLALDFAKATRDPKHFEATLDAASLIPAGRLGAAVFHAEVIFQAAVCGVGDGEFVRKLAGKADARRSPDVWAPIIAAGRTLYDAKLLANNMAFRRAWDKIEEVMKTPHIFDSLCQPMLHDGIRETALGIIGAEMQKSDSWNPKTFFENRAELLHDLRITPLDVVAVAYRQNPKQDDVALECLRLVKNDMSAGPRRIPTYQEIRETALPYMRNFLQGIADEKVAEYENERSVVLLPLVIMQQGDPFALPLPEAVRELDALRVTPQMTKDFVDAWVGTATARVQARLKVQGYVELVAVLNGRGEDDAVSSLRAEVFDAIADFPEARQRCIWRAYAETVAGPEVSSGQDDIARTATAHKALYLAHMLSINPSELKDTLLSA